MADNVLETTQVDTQAASQPDFAADLKAQMDIALNGGIPPQNATAPDNNADAGAAGDAAAVAAPDTATAQATNINDPFGLFRDKFGYETPEAAFKEIEELRAFRAAPRGPEFEVPDNESAAILKALKAGKREEVHAILDREIRIDRIVNAEVTKDTAPDIVKMGMQLKYKDLLPEEINYRYNKQYGIPPEPKQLAEEEDADYQERHSAWQSVANDKLMDLMIDAKLAKPDIQNAKSKFEIPDIESPVDEGYVQYKKMLEENARQDQATVAAYKLLTPKQLETKLAFKDEANKIAFDFQHEPDAELFNKAVDIASDADKYWKTFTNPDGSPNRTLFLESIMYALDKSKVLLSAMNQAKNAAIKAQLPDNSQGGLVRQIAQLQEPDELASQMANALKGYGNFK